MTRVFVSIVMLFSLTFSVLSQTKSLNISARVAADSGHQYISVHNLMLDFVFAGYGLYTPSDYPILTEIPVENGERIFLNKLKEITFSGERVFWKEFVTEDKRDKFTTVDVNGYRHWSDIEVNVRVVDWEGNVLKSRLKRPEYSDIYLRGETQRGELELQIDQENNKRIHMVFRPQFVMQCKGDKSHLYPNSDFIFCPYCGNQLLRITRDDLLKRSASK